MGAPFSELSGHQKAPYEIASHLLRAKSNKQVAREFAHGFPYGSSQPSRTIKIVPFVNQKYTRLPQVCKSMM